MSRDTSKESIQNFLENEERALNARLVDLREQLRPVLAEADRIERRLRTIEALMTSHTRQGPGPRLTSNRKRFSTEARELQVLGLISDRPEQLRRKEIAEELGVQIARAGKIVNGLIEDGMLIEHGGGRLSLTRRAQNIRDGRHPQEPEMAIKGGPAMRMGIDE